MIPEILFFKHLQPYNAPDPYKIRGKNDQTANSLGKPACLGNITHCKLKHAYTSLYNKTIQSKGAY